MVTSRIAAVVAMGALASALALVGCGSPQQEAASSSVQEAASSSVQEAASSSVQEAASNASSSADTGAAASSAAGSTADATSSAAASSTASATSSTSTEASSSASASAASANSSAATSTATSAASVAIGEQQAKEIALGHAGVAEADATFIAVHQDYDDGIQIWDVEFMAGNTEYDYEIDANSGNILSFDNEVEYRSAGQGAGAAGSQGVATGDYIAQDAAKQAALSHAGIAEGDCTKMSVEMEYNSSPVHYEVEFTSGGMEYSYRIDATTGDVLFSETEIDD